MQGVIPIVCIEKDFSSLVFTEKKDFLCVEIICCDNWLDNVFIPFILINKYGDCSLVVECEPVALETGVRFSPFAYDSNKSFGGQNDRL